MCMFLFLLKKFAIGSVQKPGGIYVDCTLGVGGTSLKILENSGKNAYLVGLDRDPEALAHAEKILEPYKSFVKIYHGNYSHIAEFCA